MLLTRTGDRRLLALRSTQHRTLLADDPIVLPSELLGVIITLQRRLSAPQVDARLRQVFRKRIVPPSIIQRHQLLEALPSGRPQHYGEAVAVRGASAIDGDAAGNAGDQR